MEKTLKETLAALPHTPGIYIYHNRAGKVIYVGKAIDLFKRVHQYFQNSRIEGKTAQLVSQIHSIETKLVESEFEALLLEAKTIREYLPKYNIIAKDDKSPIYVNITMSDTLPRLEMVRKRNLDRLNTSNNPCFGPFPSTTFLRGILKHIRTIVPYCTQKERTGRACFYTHIGLCDPCPSLIAKMPEGPEKRELTKNYRQHMRLIVRILSGESRLIIADLERLMEKFAKAELFEQAADVKNQRDHLIRLLGRRFNPMTSGVRMDPVQSVGSEEQIEALQKVLRDAYPNIERLGRIECMDISNFGNTLAVASLVVLTDGMPDSMWYRRFRIKTVQGQNDFAMMGEVVKRRFAHPEWPFPDLFIVDGGAGQVGAAKKALSELGVYIPLIGLAKRYESIVISNGDGFKTITLPLTHKAIAVLQRVRDEAHRFANAYRMTLQKKLLGVGKR